MAALTPVKSKPDRSMSHPLTPITDNAIPKPLPSKSRGQKQEDRIGDIIHQTPLGINEDTEREQLDRLWEEGEELRDHLRMPGVSATLESHIPEGAKCHAGDACLRTRKGKPVSRISTKYRVRVNRLYFNNDKSFPTKPWYYHAECFEGSVDVFALIPERLKLGGTSWGLVIRKW